MLALDRKPNEKIRINDDIVINVVYTRRDKVRLSIDAPRDVRVNREEVYQSKMKHGPRS